MKIDVNKLLQLDYLNDLILQINNMIEIEKQNIIGQYELDIIIRMDIENINLLFNQYDIKNDNILKLINSNFFDESWEFADLYADDISYSMEQKEVLCEKAIKEINELNSKIDLVNAKVKKNIEELVQILWFVNEMIKLLTNDGLILDADIENLKGFIINSSLSNTEKIIFSSLLVKYLIENDRKILVRKEVVDTANFEKKLEDAYKQTSYVETNDSAETSQITYSEVVLDYYKRYQKLFKDVGLGNNVDEIIDVANDLFTGVDNLLDSVPRDNFCVEFGTLLYQLQYADDEEVIADVFMRLSKLEELYKEDNKNKAKKQNLLDEIKLELSNLSKIDTDILLKNRLRNKLNLLQVELKNNIVSDIRIGEIELEYKQFQYSAKVLQESIGVISDLNEIKNKVNNMLADGTLFIENFGEDDYNRVVVLQSNVMELIKEVSENGISQDVSFKIKTCCEELMEFENKQKKADDEIKTNLRGFILFDFDEKNQPYILTDLDPSSKNNLIDRVIETGKLKSGFKSFNKLIADLLLLGDTEKLSNNDSHGYNNYKTIEPIYWNLSNRSQKNATGMHRIRPQQNDVARFIEQKVVLHSGTTIYEQVTGIIKEIVPGVSFVPSEDFNLYINFASAMKETDLDVYKEAIHRYSRGSALYKMFVGKKEKEELTEKECELLREFVHISLETYAELEKKNPNLKFNVIEQIGGMKTRG